MAALVKFVAESRTVDYTPGRGGCGRRCGGSSRSGRHCTFADRRQHARQPGRVGDFRFSEVDRSRVGDPGGHHRVLGRGQQGRHEDGRRNKQIGKATAATVDADATVRVRVSQ